MLSEKNEKSKEILNRAKKPHEKKNSPATVKKMLELWADYSDRYDAGAERFPGLHISNGEDNAKTGALLNSISLPPVVTCGAGCGKCARYCYAIGTCNRRPDAMRAYMENLNLFLQDPGLFAAGVVNACYNSRFFRWHVAGDIVNRDYFEIMVKVALRCPWCEFLAFTKKYEIVNSWIAGAVEGLPKNLHLIFSAAPGVPMPNPYGVPECHINFADSTQNTEHTRGAFNTVYHCSGNCSECIGAGCGCFYLKRGDAVIINQH